MTRRLTCLVAATFAAVPAAGLTTGTPPRGDERRTIGRGQIRFDGAGPERWAARWRRERRAASALRRQLAARLDHVVWIVRAFECVHRYEGAWNAATGNGYYGGLQMDVGFQQAYGRELLTAKGTANRWTPAEQISVAIRAHAARGFYPWPNTARRCGLLR
jgi:hypothetical protein